jgi:hypothetical protein
MVTLVALKNHPFYGRSKKTGDRYDASSFDANLMVKLGFAKVAETVVAQPVVAQPAPVVEEQKIMRVFPAPAREPAKRGRGRPSGRYNTRQMVAK